MADLENIVKIACPHCHQKLDVTQLEPFARLPCPVCKQEVIVPRRFGEFYLEEPIGSGGMATVYRALDLTLDREVAVKILSTKIIQHPEWVKLFLNEARSAAAVNHPSVVPIYSCGEVDGLPYLVMQFMGGGSLDRRIQVAGSTLLPVDFCFRAALSVAKGLDAAHRHGIVHHDVKPGNILVDTDGNVKIGDFGLAQIVRDERGEAVEALLRTWVSPYFVSPEKVRTGKEDFRGDIYSLGATLYHALTGQYPFHGDDAKTLAYARLQGNLPPPPATVRPEVPAGASDLVMDLLCPDVAGRPQSYEELNERLEKLRKALRRSGGGRSVQHSGRRSSPSGTSAEAEALGNAGVRGRHKGVTVWVNTLLCLGVILLLAVLVAFVAQKRPLWFPRVLRPQAVSAVDSGDRHVLPKNASTPPKPESAPTSPNAEGGKEAGALPQGTDRGSLSHGVVLTAEQRRSRPCPPDLDFVAQKNDLQKYLDGLPVELREVEKERILVLSQARDYLVSLMKYVPYSENPPRVRLRDGTALDATVPYCNKEEITVRLTSAGGGLQKLKWGNLAFEQYVRFFEFYMTTRLDQGAGSGNEKTAEAGKKEAAEDCFRLALLCDWYGKDPSARRYVGLAVSDDPGLRAKASKFLPDLLEPVPTP